MSAEENILQRILSAGSLGIKKTDLRKEFSETDLDAVLESLITSGQIFQDKKGSAYYCWHKDHYVQNLMNTDPRFKLIIQEIQTFEQSAARTFDGLARSIETLSNNISNLAKLSLERKENASGSQNNTHGFTLPFDEFKNEFDNSLTNASSSIGWVELAKIRNDICDRYSLSNQEFYQMVEQLTASYHDKYEFSTGGDEGITIRGLLHGYVRCI